MVSSTPAANFYQDSRDVTTTALWSVYYQSVIKHTYDVIQNTKSVSARSNLYNMAISLLPKQAQVISIKYCCQNVMTSNSLYT
jgi:urate oxidase